MRSWQISNRGKKNSFRVKFILKFVQSKIIWKKKFTFDEESLFLIKLTEIFLSYFNYVKICANIKKF